MVLEEIRTYAQLVTFDEAAVVERLLLHKNSESETSRTTFLNELKAHKARLSMLEKLTQKLYEDRLCGTVPETVFKNLIQKYEQERVEREQSTAALESRIQNMKQNEDGAAKWARLIKSFTHLETLDAQTLLRLIDRIEVGDDVTLDGKTVRRVRIVYNYVGDIANAYLATDSHPPLETEAVYEQAV